jgi:hypothetical protein
MARYVDQFRFQAGLARRALEENARGAVRHVFGWKSGAVEFYSGAYKSDDVWTVEVEIGCNRTLRFWGAGKYLLNIPPGNRGRS